MKNLKKVLALAVAFVMCFTMFASAAVFSDVPVGGDYSEAITFLSDLGVIAGKPDGTFGVNDAITRADAACLIARLMTGKTNPPKWDNHVVFTDVPSGAYYETSVGYLASLGVVAGKGGGRYAPMDTITDSEFVAMLTRALGYDTAENPLQFPMGNMVVAEQKGLLEGVNADWQSDALRGEDAQMLYNAVFADYDRAAREKNIYQAADDHYSVTIAEEVFEMARLSHDSRWTAFNDQDNVNELNRKLGNEVGFHGRDKNIAYECDAHTWVIAGVDARNRENTYVAFAIDDDTEKAIDPMDPTTGANGWAYQEFTYTGATNIEDIVGYRVELWGAFDHSTPIWDIEAIKVIDGQSAYDYNAGMYTSERTVKIGDQTLTIQGENDRNQVNMAKINLEANNTVSDFFWTTEDQYLPAVNHPDAYTNTHNNRWSNSNKLDANDGFGDAYTLARVDARLDQETSQTRAHLNFADGDQYKLIDWDSDGDIDFVVRTTYKYGEVTSISKSRIVLEVDDKRLTYFGDPREGEYSLKLGDDILKVEGADGLAEGDIVEITLVSREYDKNEGEEVVTISLTKVDPEVKTLEKINLTKDTYTFDGEELSFADPDLFDLVDENDSREEMRTKENVGQQFNIWFDRSGFMLKGRVIDDSSRGYLMILDTVDGNSNLNSNNKRDLAAIDVLFDDNTVGEEVPVVKDLKIRSMTGNTYSSTLNGYISSSRTWDQLKVIGNVYKYYMNKDGEITRLDPITINQSSDYSFDESKDRFSIRNDAEDAAGNPVNTYTTYGVEAGAPIFAARQVDATTNTDVVNVANAIGYVRVVYGEHVHNSSGHTSHADEAHYYVNADDVVAVPVEDVPEIDNRFATGNNVINNVIGGVAQSNHGSYNWRETDVTHPMEFLPTMKFVDAAGNIDFDGTPAFKSDADKGITVPWQGDNVEVGVLPESNNGTIKDAVMKDSYYFSGTAAEDNWIKNDLKGGTYSGTVQDAAGNYTTRQRLPKIAYSTNSKDEITAAVVGVDTLDYFGQSNVKLALITDVNYHSGDYYSIDAAIDGKVASFRTVADKDESDIFTGRFNSVADIQTYLNQNERPDAFMGNRYGLYAEINMDSDGLITKVRSMTITQVASWADDNTVNPDNNKVNTVWVAEGNVYRVVRGVVTQVNRSSKSSQITWQTNPIASRTDDKYVYDLRKYDDQNLFDHLEGYYDSDTLFYKINGRPYTTKDATITIETPFNSDLSTTLKEATEADLEASDFLTNKNTIARGDAVYWIADFAVRKSNVEDLAAVFMFTKEMTNEDDTAPVPGISVTYDGITAHANETLTANVMIGQAGTATINIQGVNAVYTDVRMLDPTFTKDLNAADNGSDSGYEFDGITVSLANGKKELHIEVDPATATGKTREIWIVPDKDNNTTQTDSVKVVINAVKDTLPTGFDIQIDQDQTDILIFPSNGGGSNFFNKSELQALYKSESINITYEISYNDKQVTPTVNGIGEEAVTNDGYYILRIPGADSKPQTFEFNDVIKVKVLVNGKSIGSFEYKVGLQDRERA